eukprot:scaffold219863_cov32-Tisochrysis_lutea.AAC.2
MVSSNLACARRCRRAFASMQAMWSVSTGSPGLLELTAGPLLDGGGKPESRLDWRRTLCKRASRSKLRMASTSLLCGLIGGGGGGAAAAACSKRAARPATEGLPLKPSSVEALLRNGGGGPPRRPAPSAARAAMVRLGGDLEACSACLRKSAERLRRHSVRCRTAS